MTNKFNLENLKAALPSWREAFDDTEVYGGENLYTAMVGNSVSFSKDDINLFGDDDGLWLVANKTFYKDCFKVIACSQQADGEYLFTEQYCWSPANDVLRVLCLDHEKSQQEKDRRLAKRRTCLPSFDN